MDKFDISKIKEFYNRIPVIWATDEVWHTCSHNELQKYINHHKILFENCKVLNAGSGGNNYGICCEEMHHIDIAEEKIKNCKHYAVANMENLPYKTNLLML